MSGRLGAAPTALPWQKPLQASPSVTAAGAGWEAFWRVGWGCLLQLWIGKRGVKAGSTALVGREKLGSELLLLLPLEICTEGLC